MFKYTIGPILFIPGLLFIGAIYAFIAIYSIYAFILETSLLHIGIDVRRRDCSREPGGIHSTDGVIWWVYLLVLFLLTGTVITIIGQLTKYTS
jgi:hypothetical protein